MDLPDTLKLQQLFVDLLRVKKDMGLTEEVGNGNEFCLTFEAQKDLILSKIPLDLKHMFHKHCTYSGVN